MKKKKKKQLLEGCNVCLTMMQRVKCVVRNGVNGFEQRILVSCSLERKRIEEFVDYVLCEYCNVQVWSKVDWNN